MINTYKEYLTLVNDIDRERKEEEYYRTHGECFPPERFSLLTATICFAGEKAYNELIEDIVFYETIPQVDLPPKDYFNHIEEEEEELQY